MRRLLETPRMRAVALVAAATGGAVVLAGGLLIAATVAPGGGGGGAGEAAGSDTGVTAAATPSASPISTPSPASTATPSPTRAAAVATALPAVDAAWLDRVSAAAGIPRVALAAYAGAALRMQQEAPSCRLDWATLAAIGLVESEHGTLQGGSLGPDGVARPAIVGIALDGSATTAQPDSDRGALDGDPVWDRAVGPMQLIPSTWQRFASDGDGDGVADPQQIDDAVLTAARYLCADGHDLAVSSQWIAAVSAYNVGADYNARIASATETYAATR
jgi:membrane-bound lytic murein transglycosylase B